MKIVMLLRNVSSPSSSSPYCCVAQVDHVVLWHKRLGHVNYQDLSRLSKRDHLRNLPKTNRRDRSVCGDFQIEKQIRCCQIDL